MTDKKLDTDWFDLKNYNALKTMSIEDWQKLLGERYEFHRHVIGCRKENLQFFFENDAFYKCDFLDSLVPPEELLIEISILLKQGVITNFGLGSFRRSPNNPMALRHSVNNLTVHDVAEMLKDSRLHYLTDVPKSEDVIQKQEKHWQRMLSTPFDKGDNGNAKVKIDLYATDAKIKKDFDQWLKHIRKATDYYDNIPVKKSIAKLAKKELYTQEDFDRWIKYGVIPYIDLMLVADIEYKVITQVQLGNLIFPDEPNVDTLERIRQVTKPLAEQLLKNKMHKTLLAQSDYQTPPT